MTATHAPQSSLAGPVSAMAAIFFFSVNDATFKALSDDYALHQIVLLRSVVAVPLIAAATYIFGGGARAFSTRRPVAHLLRALLLVCANLSFFLAIAALPLAEAVAIFFVSPFLISLFSVLFLGEKVGPWRWAAIGVGFLGVLIIVRPGTGAFRLASLLPLVAATCYAGMNMMTRYLGRTDGALTMAFYVQLVFVVVAGAIGIAIGDGRFGDQSDPSLAFLFRAWDWPATRHLPVLMFLGAAVACGAFLISRAYRIAEAALVAPFEYIAMPLAVLWGIAFFGEWPDRDAWSGIAMIIGAGLFTLWRESRTATGSVLAHPRYRR